MDDRFANSDISYLFDDKCKEVLDSVPPEADKLFRGRNPYYLNIGGGLLRQHLRINQNKLTRTTHRNLINPDYLAFAIMYCSDYQKYNNLDELNEDLANPYEKNFIESLHTIDSGNDSEFTTTCACSKGIEDIWKYENPDTGKGFLMGSHCINTGFILNKQEQKEIAGAFTVECERCGYKTFKTNSRGNPKKQRCSRCDKDKRRCEKCKLFKIKKDAPDWKKLCYDCYQDRPKGKCMLNIKKLI
jgi:hypothetical protein